MTQIKLITVLLSLAAIAIFYLQNQQSIALVFYGIAIPLQLPVAVWILLSLLAGILTSIAIQILSGLGRSKLKTKEAVRSNESDRFSKDPVKNTNNKPQNRSQKTTNKQPERQQTKDIDWDSPQEKKVDWDGREIQSEPNYAREIKDDFPFPPPASKEKNYEVEKKPVSETRSGSVYSYSYGSSKKEEEREEKPEKRTPEKKESNRVDRVYDANYRVIDPPVSDSPPTKPIDEDEEEWV